MHNEHNLIWESYQQVNEASLTDLQTRINLNIGQLAPVAVRDLHKYVDYHVHVAQTMSPEDAQNMLRSTLNQSDQPMFSDQQVQLMLQPLGQPGDFSNPERLNPKYLPN